MEWNVWAIKPYGITNRQLSNSSEVGEGNISTKYLAEIPTSLQVRTRGDLRAVVWKDKRAMTIHARRETTPRF